MQLIYRVFKVLTAIGLVLVLDRSIAGNPAPGDLLDPVEGLWATARAARPHDSGVLNIEGMLASAEVRMDSRGVPHIFADSDQDATIALGYVVARDRLFQMDFIHRIATGTISEMIGVDGLDIDRRFRQLGIADAVARNTELLPELGPQESQAIDWYA